MKQSEIVAFAVESALRARDDGMTGDLGAKHWEAMYLAQCSATDDWAERARAAEHAKANPTLQKRIDDLERDLATVNARLATVNGGEKDIIRAAAERAKKSLDDCTHPDCIEDRARNGYSSCAGGHLARRVVKAILGTGEATSTRGDKA